MLIPLDTVGKGFQIQVWRRVYVDSELGLDNSDSLKILLGLSSADQSEFSLRQQTHFSHTLLFKHVLKSRCSRKQ